MKRSPGYNTKQREAVLGYIASLGGSHVTAAQIVAHFESESIPIGRTTVYRHLDKLIEGGLVRKYAVNGISGACFQYVRHEENCDEHFHLKCEGCGELLHLRCDRLSEIHKHVFTEHAFQINTLKTVLYGKCDHCIRGE